MYHPIVKEMIAYQRRNRENEQRHEPAVVKPSREEWIPPSFGHTLTLRDQIEHLLRRLHFVFRQTRNEHAFL